MQNPVIRWFASLTEDVVRHHRVENSAPGQARRCGRWWQWHVALIVLLLTSGLFPDDAGAAERPRPFRIGALTAAARELVQFGVDLIFVDGADAAKAAQRAGDVSDAAGGVGYVNKERDEQDIRL